MTQENPQRESQWQVCPNYISTFKRCFRIQRSTVTEVVCEALLVMKT